MSEHHKSSLPEQAATSATISKPTNNLWKSAKFRATLLLVVALLIIAIAGIGAVLFIQYRHASQAAAKNSAKGTSPTLIQVQQRNLKSDTDGTSKAVDMIQVGSLYAEQGNSDQAIAAYKQAVALDPTNSSAVGLLLGMYAKQKDKQDAIIYGNKLIAMLANNPNDPNVHKLQFYRDWLRNIQTGNFNTPKVAHDPST